MYINIRECGIRPKIEAGIRPKIEVGIRPKIEVGIRRKTYFVRIRPKTW